MPYCPSCRYEYNEGIEKCSDCGTELVSEISDEDAAEELVPVYFSTDENEVMIVKTILEDAGIPVWEEADVVNELNPVAETMEPVYVPASRVEDAKKAIADALEAGKQLEETMEESEPSQEG